jgi:hypothetical protein
MEKFFEKIYCYFEDLFGIGDLVGRKALIHRLKGYNGERFDPAEKLFTPIGLVTLLTAVFFVLAYYYILNHPRLNRRQSWWITFGITGFLGLLIGFFWTWTLTADVETISTSNCFGFGVSNFVVAIGCFSFLSLIVKWGSRNCKHSPF